jgi:DNA-binding protein HU-beta
LPYWRQILIPRGYDVNKAELVEKLAKGTGLTKKDARAALDGVVDVITQALAKNEPVIITGFGKFETRKRKATTRMNPQTGQRIKTPAKVVPAFKAGKNLKDIVAKKAAATKRSAGRARCPGQPTE